jgi:hypothetical protein
MSFFEHIFSDVADDKNKATELTGNIVTDLENVTLKTVVIGDKTLLYVGKLTCELKRNNIVSAEINPLSNVTTANYSTGVWHFVPQDNFGHNYLSPVPEACKTNTKIEFSLSLLKLWTELEEYKHLPKYIANETNPEMAGECIKNGAFSLGVHHPWHGFPQERYRIGFATESIAKLKETTNERLIMLYTRL